MAFVCCSCVYWKWDVYGIPKNATGGFVDYHSGGGSVLDLNLPKDITIKASSLETLLIEECNIKYTVDSI